MTISPEEFFMYLTIALIVLIPLSARLYRYLTMKQVKRMVREQFGQEARRDGQDHQEKR
ncbi:MAG: hypothetical protein HY581_03135 [Nitrospirae bacterium]|nr:hypothetical protein [Nitrospirota bacterium]